MALGRDASENLARLMATIKERLDPDFTIRCGSQEFRVHSVVLETASAFWKTACYSSFKESHTGSIDLVEDNPNVVGAFVDALYQGDYGKEVNVAKPALREAWEFHVQVHYFGVKYDIDDLKDMAFAKLCQDVHRLKGRPIPKNTILDFVDQVYSFKIIDDKPDAVRRLACTAWSWTMGNLSDNAVVEALKGRPDFARDMFLCLRKKMLDSEGATAVSQGARGPQLKLPAVVNPRTAM